MKEHAMRLLLMMVLIAGANLSQGASNLLPNGSFDDKNDPLANWKYKYDTEGESWYFKNHEFVKVEPSVEGRSGVLALFGTQDMVAGTGQGTKVDSFPIPVKPGGRFRLTMTARSSGPGTRTLVEGYMWRPGVKPHANPDISELRKCFKFELIQFGSVKAGDHSEVGRTWKTASVTFPGENPTELASGLLRKVEFLIVHIVAIFGGEGTLYVDDVKVEQLSQ
jgi:hypothetical protein